jgi:hypothetical protein
MLERVLRLVRFGVFVAGVEVWCDARLVWLGDSMRGRVVADYLLFVWFLAAGVIHLRLECPLLMGTHTLEVRESDSGALIRPDRR